MNGLIKKSNFFFPRFDEVFNHPWFDGLCGFADDMKLAVDVVDNDTNVTIRAEIPGIDHKDIDISVNGDILTIAGEKKNVKESKHKGYYKNECTYGAFKRSVQLPSSIDIDKSSADYSDGVLTVTLIKSIQSPTKKIEVKKK